MSCYPLRRLRPDLLEALSRPRSAAAARALGAAWNAYELPWCPGVVRLARPLLEAWRSAQVEAGHRLTFNGNRARCRNADNC